MRINNIPFNEIVALAMVNASRAVGDYPPLERIHDLPAPDSLAYMREAEAAINVIRNYNGVK